MRHLISTVALEFLIGLPLLFAQSHQAPLAPTPPMGWNSWDSYGLAITEPQFKANVDWLSQNLKPYGWQYVVIDEGWYLSNPGSADKSTWNYALSGDGLYMPAANRFPSSTSDAGFKPLADYAHTRGLKFGLHIIRGIPRGAVEKNLEIAGSTFHAADAADRSDTCAWNPDNYGVKANDAGQAYYDSMARLYAGWGLDFLKVDCISSPYKSEEIHMLSLALRRSGRPILLSLSPGPTPLNEAADVARYAEMWRISDDLWDTWKHVKGIDWSNGLLPQFNLLAGWAGHSRPGHWPDADMLPIGHIGPTPGLGPERDSKFTHDEARTLLTLWSMARSPLMIGANLPKTDAFTVSLLTNSEVLAVDQYSEGNHPAWTTATAVAWLARPQSEAGYYLGVFNIDDTPQTITASWKDLGIDDGNYQLRDLWEHKNLGTATSLRIPLQPHASALYRLTPKP